MAYSYVNYTGDGSNQTFAYGSIPLLAEGVVPTVDQLQVTVGQNIMLPSTYTIDVVAKTVTMVTAPANGTPVRLSRVTKADDRYVDWLNQTNLNQEQLNLDSDQLLFLTQETLDNAESSIQLDANDQWDAQGKIIANVADGVDSNDAVNVQQLNAAFFGGTPGTVTGQGYVSDSSGAQTLTVASLAGQLADDVNVFLSGVRLQPGVGYTVADNADGTSLDVTLASPPSGLVEIVFTTGILAASLAQDTVENDNVVDGTLTPDKLANAGGNQFLINNPATGPEFRDMVAADLNRNTVLQLAMGSVSLNSAAPATGDVDAGSQKIINVADPVATNDAVNLETMQNAIQALSDSINATQSFAVGSVAGGSEIYYYEDDVRWRLFVYKDCVFDPDLEAALNAATPSLWTYTPNSGGYWYTGRYGTKASLDSAIFPIVSPGGKEYTFENAYKKLGTLWIPGDNFGDPLELKYNPNTSLIRTV